MTNYLFDRSAADSKGFLVDMHNWGGNIRYTVIDNYTAVLCCEHPLEEIMELFLMLVYPRHMKRLDKDWEHRPYNDPYWEGEQRPDGSLWKSTTSGNWIKVHPVDSKTAPN